MTTKRTRTVGTGPDQVLPLFPGLPPDAPPPVRTDSESEVPPAVSPTPKKKRAPRTRLAPTHLLQLKITLLYTKPPIWRRVLARDTRTLRDLHHIVQTVMGWDNEHLHAFRGSRSRRDDLPERAPLADVFTRKGAKVIYEYDFGDSWEHEIKLEKVEPYDPSRPEPLCLAGERACPPEDCGGTYGYAAILAALHNPKDPDNEELLEWVGEDFDPEAFDVDAVNRAFSGRRRR